MILPEPLESFIERLRTVDGHAPLSEAKVTSLAKTGSFVTVEENGVIVAVGVAAEHRQPSGTAHLSLETAVEPSMRFAEFESVVLEQTLGLAPKNSIVTVWSRRGSLDVALRSSGFVCERSLAHMQVPLPLTVKGDRVEAIRSMEEGEEDVLIAINAAAFAGHPEAASLDHAELDILTSQAWFDPGGVLFHRNTGGAVDAFCWTKVDDGVGEIYRIGVAPSSRGQGLGRAMVFAGFSHLAQDRGCSVGSLWVDEANDSAIGMYTSLGMTITSRNREFTRP